MKDYKLEKFAYKHARAFGYRWKLTNLQANQAQLNAATLAYLRTVELIGDMPDLIESQAKEAGDHIAAMIGVNQDNPRGWLENAIASPRGQFPTLP